MTTFESEIKTVNANAEDIFRTLSDLSNLEKIKDKLPQDKVKDLKFDTDSCSVTVDPIGNVGFRIIDREPYKTIKFQAEKSPIELNLWIQLKEAGEMDTKVKVTIKAELNMFIRGMVSKPLQDGVNKIADMLTKIPY